MYLFKRTAALIVLVLLTSPELASAQSSHDVRIKLFDLAAPTVISAAGHEGSLRFFAGEFPDAVLTVEAGAKAVVSAARGEMHVRAGEAGIFARDLRLEASPGAQIMLSVDEGRTSVPGRIYEGHVFLRANTDGNALEIINEVNLEDYVAAVVAVEYGFDDYEGSKAMAVIIRTYTLATMNKYGAEFDHVDHTLSQVYRGSENITPTIREAVKATSGEVLTHDGALIEAVYFAASGGHTADNETVWRSEARPYLRGKPDPYGAASPHTNWKSRISRAQLLSALSSAFGTTSGFVIDERSSDGRVSTIELLKPSGQRKRISGNEFRIVVIEHFGAAALKSTLFDARRAGGEYLFEGKGYGHGVGLSQWGAHELAQKNASYKEILDYYYTDVRLALLDDIDDLRSSGIRITMADPAGRIDSAADSWTAEAERIGERFDAHDVDATVAFGGHSSDLTTAREEDATIARDEDATTPREEDAFGERDTGSRSLGVERSGDRIERDDELRPPVRRIGW